MHDFDFLNKPKVYGAVTLDRVKQLKKMHCLLYLSLGIMIMALMHFDRIAALQRYKCIRKVSL